MKQFVLFFLLSMLCCGIGFSSFIFHSKKEASAQMEITRYYTSICIHEGDSLWSIASRLKVNSTMSTAEYVEDLKQMNALQDETIHAGQYLTVVYFEKQDYTRER